MIPVGPYTFTLNDARATVRNGPVLVAQLSDGLPAAALASARPALDHAAAIAEAAAPLATAAEDDPDLRDRLAALWEAWSAAAAAVRASGALGSTTVGTVAHLATSGGGVPKLSAPAVEVGWRGVAGDRQASRQHHGRPWQALCLWGTEVIDAFAATGDDLAPGRAGENITTTGLPWERVRPGAVLTIGTVTCEIWAYAVPCKKNEPWFADGDFNRMHHRLGPVSRVYATVLVPGAIRVGDAAVLLPDPASYQSVGA